MSAVTPNRGEGQPALLQFKPPLEISRQEVQELHASRWSPVTMSRMQAKGARRFAFLMPGEKLAGKRNSVSGGFIYELFPRKLSDRQVHYMFFPIRVSLVE